MRNEPFMLELCIAVAWSGTSLQRPYGSLYSISLVMLAFQQLVAGAYANMSDNIMQTLQQIPNP